MRNTQESGQISRSKKRPRPTGRSGRGRRTNSNIFRRTLAQVIEARTRQASLPIVIAASAKTHPDAQPLGYLGNVGWYVGNVDAKSHYWRERLAKKRWPPSGTKSLADAERSVTMTLSARGLPEKK